MALAFVESLRAEIQQFLIAQSQRDFSLLERINGKVIYSRPDCVMNSFHAIVQQRLSRVPDVCPANSGPTIAFDASFECGNLKHVVFKDETFFLLMDADLNSRGHTQWFLFALTNVGLRRAKFSIVNFSKSKSLYSNSMGIWTASIDASTTDARGLEELAWSNSRASNIVFRESPYSRGAVGNFYAVDFDLAFYSPHEKVLVSYCLPYSYGRLKRALSVWTGNEKDGVQVLELGKSLGGLAIHGLVVDGHRPSASVNLEGLAAEKPTVAIMARTHPGESNASWVLEGFVDFLLSSDKVAEILRQQYKFKIVPMLNPDGVVVGNYRCSLAGVDLNRRWKNPDGKLHPEILAAKHFIKNADVFVDLHGHSRHPGFFVYGSGLASRNFAKILAVLEPQKFITRHCRFGIGQGKRGTARVVANLDLKIPKSFTVETSFAIFSQTEFAQIGAALGKALLLDLPHGRRLLEGSGFACSIALIEAEDKSFDFDGTSDSGSDSNPSADNLPDVEERVAALELGNTKTLSRKKKNKENQRSNKNKSRPTTSPSRGVVLRRVSEPKIQRPVEASVKTNSGQSVNPPAKNLLGGAQRPRAGTSQALDRDRSSSRPRTAPLVTARPVMESVSTPVAPVESTATSPPIQLPLSAKAAVSAWLMRPPENLQLALRLPLRLAKVGYRMN